MVSLKLLPSSLLDNANPLDLHRFDWIVPAVGRCLFDGANHIFALDHSAEYRVLARSVAEPVEVGVMDGVDKEL